MIKTWTNCSSLKVATVLQDINDNKLQFRADKFYVGVPFDASVGDLVMDVTAFDPGWKLIGLKSLSRVGSTSMLAPDRLHKSLNNQTEARSAAS